MAKLFVPLIDNGLQLFHADYTFSLFRAGMYLARKYPRLEFDISRISYPYPSGAMDIVSDEFMASDADRMLIIDGDELFTPEDVELLLSHQVPLVFGAYCKKRRGFELALETWDRESPYGKETADGLLSIKHAARGFMSVSREVFEKIKPNCPTYIDSYTGKEMVQYWPTLPGGHSEDFAFCEQWRNAGGTVWLDPRIFVRHKGWASYPMDDELEAMTNGSVV